MTEKQHEHKREIKCELFCDNFQNYKVYGIPYKAQLVIADIPYNLGTWAHASNPDWYVNGDNKNGESSKANKSFFNTDFNFNIAEFFHFCSKLLKPEPKEINAAPAMIVFCSWQQIPMIQKYGEKHGFKKSYPIYFIKNTSPQVLKSNMKIVGAVELALVLYRDKLPKFRNEWSKNERNSSMILNWFEWPRSKKVYPKIHPTQKPVELIKTLIKTFTDPYDVVIDPCAGSASTLRAAYELRRNSYGFEVSRDFYKAAMSQMLDFKQMSFDNQPIQLDMFNKVREI